MTLTQRNLYHHLEQHFRDRLPPGKRGSVDIIARPWSFTLEVSDSDRLSVVIRHITLKVQPPELSMNTWPYFVRWVHTWVEHIHYLAEPLAVIEQESRENRILIRSHPPSTWAQGSIQFHEIWWQMTPDRWEAQWNRIGVDRTDRRMLIDFVVPRTGLLQCFYDTWVLWSQPERWKRVE